METLAAGDFQTVLARAELCFFRRQFAEIVPLCEGFLKQPGKTVREQAMLQDRASAALEEFAARLRQDGQETAASALADSAATLQRQAVAKVPELGLALAMRLNQQGKFDAALAWLEQAAPQADRAALADVAIHMLSAAPSASQRGQIEKILTPLIDNLGRPAPLLERIASAYDAQQQYAKSESFYREAIGKDAARLGAMNNLAYQLALQHRQLGKALELIDKAIGIAGSTAPLLDTRAIVHEARGEMADALADVTGAIAGMPKPLYFFHQARILAAMKDPSAARQAEAKAQQLGFTLQLLHPLERVHLGERRSSPDAKVDTVP